MTLTQAAQLTRRSVVIVIILAVLGLVGIVGYHIWYQYYLAHLPKIEPKPEMKFGVLPAITFPDQTISSANFSYTVDTATGNLPEVPKMMKVYFMPKTSLSLMGPDKAKVMATNLGFENGPQILAETLYKFTDTNGGSLTIDLSNGNFHFQRGLPFEDNSATSSAGPTGSGADKKQLIDLFRNYLAKYKLLPVELANGRGEATLNNPALPGLVEVSLWPEDLDQIPIITASFKIGIARTMMAVNQVEESRFQKVDFTFWPIDLTTSSTYPLKTTNQALADLKGGLGFISQDPGKPQVSITSSYLAYYQTEDYLSYLQPVFVFEGPGFIGIVPGLDLPR